MTEPESVRSLGAILAGGGSTRFGSPKGLALVGGQSILARVVSAVRAGGADPVLITGQPELFTDLALPSRPDLWPNAGPLAGIHAALRWAQEAGRPGALCVGCDMPFLDPRLLSLLVDTGAEGGAEVVVPESGSPAGLEPLCAWYSVRALPQVEAGLERGLAPRTVLAALDVRRLPIAALGPLGDPSTLFLNVNTPADLARAEALASADGSTDEG